MLVLEVLLITIFPNRHEWLPETWWLNKEIRISRRSVYLTLYHHMQSKGQSERIFPKLLMEMADNTQERLTFEMTNFKFLKDLWTKKRKDHVAV